MVTIQMKPRHILTAIVCALTLATGAQAQGGGGGGGGGEQGPTTPLGEQMRMMNAAYRALGPLIEAGNADSALAKVAIIHKGATEALKFEPAKKADTPAAEQEKFVADYQTTLKAFIADVEKVEAALKAGKMDEAKPLAANLRMDQMAAHRQFRKMPPGGGRGGSPR